MLKWIGIAADQEQAKELAGSSEKSAEVGDDSVVLSALLESLVFLF